MKIFLTLLLTSFSLTAFAFPETVCDGSVGGKRVSVEIERGFPNSSFRHIELFVSENGQTQRENYTASVYSPPRFSRVQFTGPGLRLEIDFWPDARPQWGRSYRGTLQSNLLENRFVSLFCRYQ